MFKTKENRLKISLLSIVLLLICLPSINANSDFSVEFLQSRLKSKNKTQTILPSKDSLESEWLTIHNEEQDQCLQDSQHYELYLKTEYELACNRAKKAANVSKVLLDSNPPPAAHIARARLLFEEGKFFEMVQLPFFSQLSKSSDWEAVLMGAKAYEMVGMSAKAEELFDHAMEKHADKDQVVYHRVIYALKQNQNDKALQIIDSFLNTSNPKGRHSIFYQLKAAIKLQQSPADLTAALLAINKSIELNPRSEKGLKMKVVILDQLLKNKKPVDKNDLIQTYKHTCALTDDQDLKKALIDKLFQLGSFEHAYKELETLNDASPEHFFDLALLAFKSENYELAEYKITRALEKNKTFLKALLLKFEILLMQDRDKAADFVIDWFASNEHKNIACKGMLHILKTKAPNEKILAALKENFAANPKDALANAAYADAAFFCGKYADAINLYEKFIQNLDAKFAEISLKANLIYNHSAANFFLGKYGASEARLQLILHLADDFPEVYHLAALLEIKLGDKSSLEQALTLAQKAVKLAPNNPYFLNTTSFILAKIGQPTAAFKTSFVSKVFDPFGLAKCSRFSLIA